MTGYAVTFNKRHKRAGHLFQNRYKSIICEEDPYLLKLIRYIHLNPLRAKLVKDLDELDKYPWAGHSAILGRRKNPLTPKIRDQKSEVRNGTQDNPLDGKNGFNSHQLTANSSSAPAQKSLAEKTIEDVLLHFGETKKAAHRRYRDFVEKGIDQGRRPEFQGGGLVRSAGGNKAGLLGRKKEDREKGDARILGSGDFVSRMLEETDRAFETRKVSRPTISAITDEVISCLSISPAALFSRSRNRQVSKARAAISYLAVREAGYTQEEVSAHLNLTRIGVRNSLQRCEKGLDICRQIWEKIA